MVLKSIPVIESAGVTLKQAFGSQHVIPFYSWMISISTTLNKYQGNSMTHSLRDRDYLILPDIALTIW
jgi:hypothetical protein